jgi:hypothetical protein
MTKKRSSRRLEDPGLDLHLDFLPGSATTAGWAADRTVRFVLNG